MPLHQHEHAAADQVPLRRAISLGRKHTGSGQGGYCRAEDYNSLPPIIIVARRAAITVMVGRDLEFW